VLKVFWSLAIVLTLTGSGGCISHFSVTKVTPGSNPRGVRVHLPAPFVVGRPSPDGTVAYGIEYLPDPDEEYAIDAWSIMAKQKADISRTVEMYVQKMALTQDTTAVAAQLASSAGAVSKSAVDSLIAQQQANTALAKTRSDAIAAKEADLAQKEAAFEKANVDVETAQEALDAANAAGNANAIAAAQTTLNGAKAAAQKAKIDVDTAKNALAKARNYDQATSRDQPADSKPAGTAAVAGPIVYRIVADRETGGIRLERVNFKLFSFNGKVPSISKQGTQLDFGTWGKKPAQDTSGKQSIPKPKGSTDFTVNKTLGVFTQTIQFDNDIKTPFVNDTTVLDNQLADQKKWLTKIEKASVNSIALTWDKDTPNGNYAVKLWVLFKDDRAFPFSLKVEVK
jgi:hypothetical protein